MSKIIATIKADGQDGRCQLYIEQIDDKFVVMAITPNGDTEQTPVWGRTREEAEDGIYKAYNSSVWDLQYTD